MNTVKTISILMIAISLLSTQAFAQNNKMKANVSNDMIEREIANFHAPVKSQMDLRNFMASNRTTALDALSQNSKRDFIGSLKFTKKGLSSFNYNVLEAELTPTEIYGILSMFGLQRGTGQFDNARPQTSLDQAILNLYGENNRSIQANSGFESQFHGGSWGKIADEFLEGYRCLSQGTCVQADGHACTSNC